MIKIVITNYLCNLNPPVLLGLQHHDLIVLFQLLFLNLILIISFKYFQPQRVLIKNQHTSTQMIAIKYLDRDLCSTLPRTLPLNAEHQWCRPVWDSVVMKDDLPSLKDSKMLMPTTFRSLHQTTAGHNPGDDTSPGDRTPPRTSSCSGWGRWFLPSSHPTKESAFPGRCCWPPPFKYHSL